MIIQENVSLLPFNTFGIEANARYFAEYSTLKELFEVLKSDIFKTNKFIHIGSGSNLLYTTDYDGIVLHSVNQKISIISENANDVIVEAAAGVIWNDLVAFCVEKNLCGIENLTDIPGETGAAAVQNIGAYGMELKDVIVKVVAVDTQSQNIKEFNTEECEYGYRTSIFKHKYPGRFIITSVIIQLTKNNNFQLNYQHLEDVVRRYGEVNLQHISKAISHIRSSKLPDPKVQGNAGSFFMNPVLKNNQFAQLYKKYPQLPNYPISSDQIKIPAAWLIEQCGFKGKTLGRAGVHPFHALVIVNLGNATAAEIIYLASEIINAVEEKFGIRLQPEVIYV